MSDEEKQVRYRTPIGYLYVRVLAAHEERPGRDGPVLLPQVQITPQYQPDRILRNDDANGHVTIRGREYTFLFHMVKGGTGWNREHHNADYKGGLHLVGSVGTPSQGVKDAVDDAVEAVLARLDREEPTWAKRSRRLWHVVQVEGAQAEVNRQQKALDEALKVLAYERADLEKWETENA